MVTLVWQNEKGNVSAKVREQVRTQLKAKMGSALSGNFNGVVENVNGGYSVPVAVDSTSGDTIYAHIEITLNTKLPTDKTEKKKTAKKTTTTAVEVPNLFGDYDLEERA